MFPSLDEGGDTLAQIRSIAVLPLENLSGDPEQQYFADGMTASLIGDLSKIRALHVISRRSVLPYQDTDKSLAEIARELNVDAIIEGAVLRAEDRVRINVELIDTRADRQLWSDRYQGELSDVLALQSDVARAVADQVRIELSPEEHSALSVSHTVDPLAFDTYLRGLQISSSKPAMTIGTWGPQAIELFKQAVALDTEFADAWAALGRTQAGLGRLGLTRRHHGELVNAKEAIQKALDLDNQRGDLHATMGGVLLYVDWDIAGARRAFEKAVALSPNHPAVLTSYATFLWEVEGKIDDALAYSRRALQLAPFSSGIREGRIWQLFQMRQYENALAEVEQAQELDPNFATNATASLYLNLGRIREGAAAQFEFWEQRDVQERFWTDGGIEEYRRASLAAQQSGYFEVVSPWVIAMQYANIGETDDAIDWLERGVRERDPTLITALRIFPAYDLLRFDPRFQDLVYRVTGTRVLDEDPRVLAGVAQTLVRAGRAAEAIPHLEKAIERYPADTNLPRWLYYLSLAHFAEERYARTNCANAELCFAHLDRFDEAREAFNEAVRLWPGQLEIEEDLRFIFTIREPALQNRYLIGLRQAAMNG